MSFSSIIYKILQTSQEHKYFVPLKLISKILHRCLLKLQKFTYQLVTKYTEHISRLHTFSLPQTYHPTHVFYRNKSKNHKYFLFSFCWFTNPPLSSTRKTLRGEYILTYIYSLCSNAEIVLLLIVTNFFFIRLFFVLMLGKSKLVDFSFLGKKAKTHKNKNVKILINLKIFL